MVGRIGNGSDALGCGTFLKAVRDQGGEVPFLTLSVLITDIDFFSKIHYSSWARFLYNGELNTGRICSIL